MYKQVELELTPVQIKKAIKGQPIQLSAGAIASNKHKIYVHPENYKKIMKAKKNKTGCRLNICKGAIEHDVKTMKGGSLWDSIKEGASKVWNWLKDSGVATAAADALQQTAAPIVGDKFAQLGRNIVKGTVGVGIAPKKGSVEAKEKMAKLRAMRKSKSTGGSFKLN